MESPHREAEPGQQEQELRQILNKDKSKRSKSPSVCVGTWQRVPHPCLRIHVPKPREISSQREWDQRAS